MRHSDLSAGCQCSDRPDRPGPCQPRRGAFLVRRSGWPKLGDLPDHGKWRVADRRHANYPNTQSSPASVAHMLQKLLDHPGHVFWPDEVSLLDRRHVDATRLLTHKQVTDTYILALAASRGGKLATLDRRPSAAAVHGGAAALHLI